MHNVSLVEIIRRNLADNVSEFRNNCLYYVTEKMSVEELSTLLGIAPSKIINYFWDQGKTVGRSQYLPLDWLQDYCRNSGIKLRKKKPKDWRQIITEYLTKINDKAQLKERPPIVSIMGHVDHGKTTLLDTIRQTHYQEKEVGGITQKISVSPIVFQGKKIVFLDTPGHSDFIRMRQRGISLTDIVILVISASDGVMLQTEEIISYLQDYQLPVVVFINHQRPNETDNEATLDRIKSQCQERGLTPLDWGGDTIFISGNAKQEKSVNYLCENILLLADYRTNWQRPASGVVIDSYLHPRTGEMLTELLIQGGYLQEKDEIFLAGKFGLAKMIFDPWGQKIRQAFPGDLVRVIGGNFPTELGEKFLVIKDERTKKEILQEVTNWSEKKNQPALSPSSGKKNVNLVLLADSQNSQEALNNLVAKSDNSQVNFSVVYSSVGKLNSFGLNLAKITQSVILAFGYQFSSSEIKIFRENNLSFYSSKIIYEIEEKLKKIVENQQEKKQVEKVMGVAQVSHVFYFSKVGNIAGCQIISGKIARNNFVHVFRGEEQLFTGSIRSLESDKITVKEISSGRECGIVLKGFDDFQIGDKVIAFQMKEESILTNE